MMEVTEQFTSNTKKVTKNKSNLFIQHAAACTVSISAFAVGNLLGWSSPATVQLAKGAAGFIVNEEENSLVSSLMTMGAAVSCLPTGYITDKIGRKKTLLGLVPIFSIGWSLIIWASAVYMLYLGRFLLGICAGAACVTAPVYTAEICQKEIRGTLGSYFQLLMATGIVFAYLIGGLLELFWFSVVCGLVPIIFAILLFFFPESPVYHLTKGNVKEARESLRFYRGSNYDIELEYIELTDFTITEKDNKESIWDVFISQQGRKAVAMSIGIMIFQQFSGINAFVFNATDIFENAGSTLEAKYETVIVGVTQVIGTFCILFLIDRLGRVMILWVSAMFMSICTLSLGIYFYFKDNYNISDFSWLPLVSFCFLIFMFSVGYGPIPWMLMSELIPSKIKGPGSSIVCVFNWLGAFVVTKFYFNLTNLLGRGITFCVFALLSASGAIYSYKVLPETKGKSLDEIQKQLSGFH